MRLGDPLDIVDGIDTVALSGSAFMLSCVWLLATPWTVVHRIGGLLKSTLLVRVLLK